MKAIVAVMVLVILGSLSNRAYAQRACAGGGTSATTSGIGTVSPSSLISTSGTASQQAYLQQMAYQQQMQQMYLQNQYLQNQLLEQRTAAEQDRERVEKRLAARQERRDAEIARREAAKQKRLAAKLAARE